VIAASCTNAPAFLAYWFGHARFEADRNHLRPHLFLLCRTLFRHRLSRNLLGYRFFLRCSLFRRHFFLRCSRLYNSFLHGLFLMLWGHGLGDTCKTYFLRNGSNRRSYRFRRMLQSVFHSSNFRFCQDSLPRLNATLYEWPRSDDRGIATNPAAQIVNRLFMNRCNPHGVPWCEGAAIRRPVSLDHGSRRNGDTGSRFFNHDDARPAKGDA
jgi:hypothetical protein